jgi:hypothetical protein
MAVAASSSFQSTTGPRQQYMREKGRRGNLLEVMAAAAARFPFLRNA